MSLPLSAIPKVVALFETTLASKILSSDTGMTLSLGTDKYGSTLSGVFGAIIDEGTASEEFVIGTFAGTAVTGMLRGIDPQDGTTERSTLKKDHRRGATVKITDFAFLGIVYRLLDGTEGFPNKLKYVSHPTFSANEELIDKKYADDLAIAGAPDASTIVKGLVEEATAAELIAGTAAGGTSARLFANPSTLAAQIQAGSWLYAVEDGTGADDTYTFAFTPALTAYTAGMLFLVKLTVANTGACTGNANGLGAKNIKKYAAGAKADPETGDIVANMACLFYYDGTDLVLLNPGATMPTTAILSEMSTFFSNTDITGAEAEDLTDGGQTVLHYHPYQAGVVADLSTSAEANNDVTVTTNFTPRLIKLHYFIQGHDQSTESNVYLGMKGIAVYDGTTLKFNHIIAGTESGGSALTGDNGTFTAVTAFVNVPNSTAVPVVGNNNTGSGGVSQIKLTLSIASVSATDFVIRRVTATGEGASSSTARAKIAYEVIG